MLTAAWVQSLAEHARIDRRTMGALLAFCARLEPSLYALALRAAEQLSKGAEASTIGVEPQGEDAPLFYLLVALLQLPRAQALHAARGIDPAVSRATWADLSVWCHHLRKREGRTGLALEALDWLQHAIRGHLLRIGSLQFEPSPFIGSLELFARREGDDTTPALGDPMLRVHIPADSRLSLHEFLLSAGDALELFARLEPALRPRGVFGETWLFDPQVAAFLPDPARLLELRSICSLYPGSISEEKTVRRLFGPSATRASVLALPLEPMSSLQRAVADFLSDEGNALRAQGGFVLTEKLWPLIHRARAKR